jgi:hypothetical protein
MEQAASSERRISNRKRTLLAAKVVFADGASTVDCVIRDRSETGARIAVGSFATLPEDFRLVITGRGEALSAHMVWSPGDGIGVSFPPKNRTRNVARRSKRCVAGLANSSTRS